jgi:hypothetical protein
VPVEDRDQFIIVDIAEAFSDVDFAQPPEVRHQLTKTHIAR